MRARSSDDDAPCVSSRHHKRARPPSQHRRRHARPRARRAARRGARGAAPSVLQPPPRATTRRRRSRIHETKRSEARNARRAEHGRVLRRGGGARHGRRDRGPMIERVDLAFQRGNGERAERAFVLGGELALFVATRRRCSRAGRRRRIELYISLSLLACQCSLSLLARRATRSVNARAPLAPRRCRRWSRLTCPHGYGNAMHLGGRRD